jgi:hypothetical protein
MGLSDQLSALGVAAIALAVFQAPRDKSLSNKIGYVGSGLLLFGGMGDFLEIITVMFK